MSDATVLSTLSLNVCLLSGRHCSRDRASAIGMVSALWSLRLGWRTGREEVREMKVEREACIGLCSSWCRGVKLGLLLKMVGA